MSQQSRDEALIVMMMSGSACPSPASCHLCGQREALPYVWSQLSTHSIILRLPHIRRGWALLRFFPSWSWISDLVGRSMDSKRAGALLHHSSR